LLSLLATEKEEKAPLVLVAIGLWLSLARILFAMVWTEGAQLELLDKLQLSLFPTLTVIHFSLSLSLVIFHVSTSIAESFTVREGKGE
jgi:hypothetical protein